MFKSIQPNLQKYFADLKSKVGEVTIKIMRITLVSGEPFQFEGANGQSISGFQYAGFTDKGKAIRFTSNRQDHKTYEGEVEFNPEASEEINLKVRIWDGKVKYREI